MPTIGSYLSLPNDRFNVRRSYLTYIRLRHNQDNHPATLVNGQFIWPSAAFPNIVQFATMLPAFLPHSTNSYTLDFLITEYYFTVAPLPDRVPNSGLILRYLWDTQLEAMIIELQKELPDRTQVFNLTGGVGGYWLDPVPT